MNLLSLASAFPESSYSQKECLVGMQKAQFWNDLNPGSRKLLEKVLEGDSGIGKSGIGKRHFMVDCLADSWRRDAQGLNEAYEAAAPKLAADAVIKAVEKSEYKIEEIDALFLCSCTGYLCPGVSSYVAEMLGMREDAFLQDMTGYGCGAAAVSYTHLTLPTKA